MLFLLISLGLTSWESVVLWLQKRILGVSHPDWPKGCTAALTKGCLHRFIIVAWTAVCLDKRYYFNPLLTKGGVENDRKRRPKTFFQALCGPIPSLQSFPHTPRACQKLWAYETISRSQATDAKGLIHCLPLLEDLLQISPCGEIHPNPLRQSIMKLVQEKPAMNQTDWNCQVWTNLRAERVTVILLHLRRLKSEEEMRKCVGKLTGKDCLQLKKNSEHNGR